MCGIKGIISAIGNKGIDIAVFSLIHRGPDDHGILMLIIREEKIEFVHTRLPVLDLSSSGSQPMESRRKVNPE